MNVPVPSAQVKVRVPSPCPCQDPAVHSGEVAVKVPTWKSLRGWVPSRWRVTSVGAATAVEERPTDNAAMQTAKDAARLQILTFTSREPDPDCGAFFPVRL